MTYFRTPEVLSAFSAHHRPIYVILPVQWKITGDRLCIVAES